MIRAIIQSVYEGVIKRFSASGHSDEIFTNREYFQHYGFTSRPLSGAEAIINKEGNHIIMIASDDRRYRLAIEAGEVCLYTDEGDHIRFKRGKEIYIKSGNKLKADIENDVEVNTKRLNANASESATIATALLIANASTSVTVTTPKCQINSQEINFSGDRAGLRRFIDDRFRELFNTHVHSGVLTGGNNTGAPTTTLELVSHATDTVRGV